MRFACHLIDLAQDHFGAPRPRFARQFFLQQQNIKAGIVEISLNAGEKHINATRSAQAAIKRIIDHRARLHDRLE